MSYIQNKGSQYSSTFKSPEFYQNHKPQYFGVKTNDEPKKFTSFNSLSAIENNNLFYDFKMSPTITSLKSIPETYIGDAQKNDIFKNMMIIAISNKWTERDI